MKTTLSPLHRAVRWATKLHAGQNRDGETPVPYISHPIDVLTKARYIGGVTDESILVTCVLHDVVEECDTTIKKVKRKFGHNVAQLVGELTREEPDPNVLIGLSDTEIWKLRSDLLCDGISKMSPQAQLIKLADRLSNLEEAAKTRSGEKLTRYIDQTKRILQIIPRKTSPTLYDAISSLVAE